jgi:hypothetical protein
VPAPCFPYDNKLIPLFKILSPTHLLKLPFANDSNTLDKGFYTELLYLIGLEEVKEGSKKLAEIIGFHAELETQMFTATNGDKKYFRI